MDWMAERMDFSLLHSVIEGVPLSPEELLCAAEDTLKLLPSIPELPGGAPSEALEPAASSDQVAPHTPPPSPQFTSSTIDPSQLNNLTSLTTVVCHLSDDTSLTSETHHLLDLPSLRTTGCHFSDWSLSVTGDIDEPVGNAGELAGGQDDPSFLPVAAGTKSESAPGRESDRGPGLSEPGSRGVARLVGGGRSRPSGGGAGARRTPPPGSRKHKKMEQNKSAAVRYRWKKRAEQRALEQECGNLEQKNKTLSETATSLLTEIQVLQNLLADIGKAKS
ncbi:cyclic AMP-dependent transcription factor ATF-4-like [Callorhinchus milii]|uniref:cyclic AMP-dependent transcription factor ATF-4-like n=1 Tax=Callorhinchus milii TaxID=7868 RepID=UPI001C3F4F54|nr:cyclic AMP-dependent transcription factor ATF-4-like [Callorhinchus milii]XP_007909466.2 cyclic AMP-dependent transcription factor ATF-4-like [Callorhinchus milii]